MLTKKTIGFIGAGNMAEALINGLVSSRLVSPARIIASDTNKDRLVHLAEEYEIKIFNKNYEVARTADIVFLSIKPQNLSHVLGDIAKELAPATLVVSVAAGKTTDTILNGLRSGGLAHPVPVMRAMPNTPALIGEGAIGVYRASGVTDQELEIVNTILRAVGEVIVFTEEALLDAVTGLSGSGPAYVFMFMEALIEAGVENGMSIADARAMVLKTTLGSARLARESKKELSELIDMVTSPGGTTIEGLNVFEKAGIKATVKEAVDAAVKRARELSGGE